MECDNFLALVNNYQPQDLTQVERIWLICHFRECESCRVFISGLPTNDSADEEMRELAQSDKRVLEC